MKSQEEGEAMVKLRDLANIGIEFVGPVTIMSTVQTKPYPSIEYTSCDDLAEAISKHGESDVLQIFADRRGLNFVCPTLKGA